MEKVKSFFREFDLFAALPTLRAKSNPETVNTCGGILSLLVTLFFIYIFISQFIQVASWDKIEAVQTRINDINPKTNISKFMIGIGVEGFPLDISYPYIRFEFIQMTMNGTRFVSSRILQKEKCTLKHWEPQLGSEAEDSFNSFSVQNKYCIAKGENFTINQISNGEYKILSVIISNCRRLTQNNQSIYQNCASQQEILQGNNAWIQLYKYFTVTTVFSNTGFQPTQKESTKKYMDIIRSTFTIKRGTQTFVYLSKYKITTDTSIMPLNDYTIQEGHFLDQSKSENFESNIYFENINIFFSVSSNSIQVQRKVGKVDDILSYAGGLFGIIISLLSFFMMSFNEYRYQIMVGQEAFNYSEDGSKVKQHDFSFLLYVKYSLYDWIKTLTCFQPKWKHCKQIDETRQEANKQLNVTLLFKKIQHIEKIIQYILPEKEDIGIYLTEPPTMDQVIRKRRIAEYYEKVIKGKSATTVEDIDNVTHILNFAMGLQNSRSQLVINSETTKRKLNEDPLKSREDILQKIFENFEKDIEIEDTNLDSEDEKIQLQIAESFFRMNEVARKKIQEKIPLKILFRLKKRHEGNISKSKVSINLQI